tara:strand:- start:2898 stop:3257 length:360 start_codon:yes stop_codon:yes gene_type:complete
MQEKGVRKMPKVGDKNFPYTQAGKVAAKEYAMETGQDIIPTYDAGGRVERIQAYNEGGKVEKVMSHKKTSSHFQGTPQDVAERMNRNSAFKKGMEKYYNMTLNEQGKLVSTSVKKNKKK